jgi:hypothetical protein
LGRDGLVGGSELSGERERKKLPVWLTCLSDTQTHDDDAVLVRFRQRGP